MRAFIYILSVFLIAGCSDSRSKFKVGPNEEVQPVLAFSESAPKQSVPVSIVTERKLIKDGSLSFVTDDLDKTKIAVQELIKKLGAYSSNEEMSDYSDRLVYSQTIRVPANGFEELIAQVEKLADKVESKRIESRDVTEEYIDVESRLKTKREVEASYRDLLKIAKKVDEILSIERELGTVRGEIESMQGKLNYLNDRVSFSTLELTYYKKLGVDFGFGSKFINSLSNGWDNMLGFIIGLVNIWPFLILIAVLVWWIRKIWRKRKKPDPA